MRRFLAVLAAVVLIPAAIYAGWEALMLELTNPADGDLISVQDVSDKTKSAAGTTKHLLLSDLWGEYLDTKVAAWLGIDPTTLTADYFIKVKSAGGGIEESQTLSVDISGFSPSMVLYSDVNGYAQPHPTVSTQELAMLDGYNVSAGTIEERFSAISAGTGEVDFWAYVKDADGFVSVGDVETVIITIEDRVVTGWTITATQDVWQADLTTLTPLSVDFDGTSGTLKASLDDVSSTGDWYFASDVLYTYSTTDPDSAYTTITASTDAAPSTVTPAEPVLHIGGDKQIEVGGSKLLEVR